MLFLFEEEASLSLSLPGRQPVVCLCDMLLAGWGDLGIVFVRAEPGFSFQEFVNRGEKWKNLDEVIGGKEQLVSAFLEGRTKHFFSSKRWNFTNSNKN